MKLNISWPSDIDPEVKDLISKILKKNPNERLSIEKILSHSFFTKYFPKARIIFYLIIKKIFLYFLIYFIVNLSNKFFSKWELNNILIISFVH